MTASLILGVRLIPNNFQRIQIDNVNLDSKIEHFKEIAAIKLDSQKQNLELVYCGVILEDDTTLTASGVKPFSLIHVLEKKVPPIAKPSPPLSEADIQQLVVAFRAFTLAPGYRTALQKLSRMEVLENVIAVTPGLREDSVAIALLQDPELIVHMSDPETVRRVAELHPSLIEAANHIAAHVHEEAANLSQTQNASSSGYSYSLEALSDDEEMDSSNSDPPREGNPLTRNQSYNAITAAQLAAAIANATGGSGPSNPTTASAASTANPIITSEMFSNAMQQAFASSVTPSSSQPPSASGFNYTSTPLIRAINEGSESNRPEMQPQVQQMVEMGLVNESINMRALRATSGDVQAAIELVLSGAFE